MGVGRMQGVSAHIEYIKRKPDNVEFVNCKFWKNEICYNTISLKYGEMCYSKRRCAYSIPLPKVSKKKTTVKTKQKIDVAKVEVTRPIRTYKVKNIKKAYFNKEILTEIKVKENIYNIKCNYDNKNQKLNLSTVYLRCRKKHLIDLSIDFNDAIKIVGNEVIFTITIDKIIRAIKNTDISEANKIATLIRANNSSNIIRKAIVSDEKEIRDKVDSLIKFTTYVVIKGLMEIY